MRDKMNVLITGGAGFIGSHVVKHFLHHYPDYQIYNLDALTYAGNPENLSDVENLPNYHFIHGDITDTDLVSEIFENHQISDVIHLAAESHVDRSIIDPISFVKTNVLGTVALLHQAKQSWQGHYNDHTFYHVSTDEVFGSLGSEGFFTEETPYDPRSPYSASKASSDHFVRAYANTYGLKVKISNCSNNYGPYQFPEKLIPLIIHNIRSGKELPVYGDGKQIRDWLHVEDHVGAIDRIFHDGRAGETYNVGGNCELQNIDLVIKLCDVVDQMLSRPAESSQSLIRFVRDRPGHDRRYAIDCDKIMQELKWSPKYSIQSGLEMTVKWYLENEEWLDHVTTGVYRQYYEKQYR